MSKYFLFLFSLLVTSLTSVPYVPTTTRLTLFEEPQEVVIPFPYRTIQDINPEQLKVVYEGCWTLLDEENPWAFVGPCRPCIAMVVHDARTQRTFIAHYHHNWAKKLLALRAQLIKELGTDNFGTMNITFFSENSRFTPRELASQAPYLKPCQDILRLLRIDQQSPNITFAQYEAPYPERHAFGSYGMMNCCILVNNRGQIFSTSPMKESMFLVNDDPRLITRTLQEIFSGNPLLEKIKFLYCFSAVRMNNIRCVPVVRPVEWLQSEHSLADLKREVADNLRFNFGATAELAVIGAMQS